MIPHTIDPASETYFFRTSQARGHHMLFVTRAMETRNPCTPLWVGACHDARTLSAFARWLAVRRDEWQAWGRRVELIGYDAFDRYLRARIEAEPYGEASATIVRMGEGNREIVIGEEVQGSFGQRDETLCRHRFRTAKARSRFLAWLYKDNHVAELHAMIAIAFERGTIALGEALDEIANGFGISKSRGERRRQSQSQFAG